MANFSRRGFLAGSAAAGVAVNLGAGPAEAEGMAMPERAAGEGGHSDGLILVNGTVRTMDGQDTVASSVTVRDGRVAAVGDHGDQRPGDRVVDLEGRTVVPGLIDNHNHIVLLGLRPGHDVRLERPSDIGEVQAALRVAAERVPVGEFLTAIGGWDPAQFASGRLPTLAELDAATTDHPVYVQVAFAGPGATNTPGKRFFEQAGIPVGADGAVDGGAPPNPATRALAALRARQTLADQVRGTQDALRYGLGLGVTTHMDMGMFIATGTDADGAAHGDPYTAYDAFLELHRQGGLDARLRVFFLSMDTAPEVPMLSARLQNAFREFGDDRMRVSGVGEFITAWPLFGGPDPANYDTAVRMAAERGWIYQQHSLSLHEDQLAAGAMERVNRDIPIADLHWSVAHVPFIDAATLERLHAIGAGVALHGWRYLAGTPENNGPPYRTILDSGIHAGAGSDSAQISPLNPWLNLYYMVTGKNAAGELVNPGQTLSRAEALRLYTRDNAWFSKEEGDLGSIEVGKLADLVVLSADYFDSKEVPDEGIKDLTSVLTIVGGEIAHEAPSPS